MNSILTVSSAATSQDLTILSSLKTELGITGTSEDTRLAAWIRQASNTIATECNRVFGQETLSELFRLSTSTEQIVLARYPVASIASVTEDSTLLESTSYEVDSETGILYRLSTDCRVCWNARKIVVVYDAGYILLDELPHRLERACVSLVKNYRAQTTRDPMAKRIEIPDVMTTDYWVGSTGENGALPPDVADLIAPYKNWRL